MTQVFYDTASLLGPLASNPHAKSPSPDAETPESPSWFELTREISTLHPLSEHMPLSCVVKLATHQYKTIPLDVHRIVNIRNSQQHSNLILMQDTQVSEHVFCELSSIIDMQDFIQIKGSILSEGGFLKIIDLLSHFEPKFLFSTFDNYDDWLKIRSSSEDLSVLNNYIGYNDNHELRSFINDYSEIKNLLIKAYPVLNKQFPDSKYYLDLFTDPDSTDEFEQLFVTIDSDHPVDMMLSKLKMFDNEWWLNHARQANNRLIFTI